VLGKNPAFQNTLKRPITRAKIMEIVIRIPGLIDPFVGPAISVEHGSKNNTMKISGMSFQRLDAKFFRRAKKLNRAVEITDSHAYIPAIRDSPEIRVPLPNRRLKTMEERQAAIDERLEEIGSLDEEIEVERRALIDLVRKYGALKSGAADVVVQNLKIQALMEKRKVLQYPERFLPVIEGVTLKDIFESKRDTRKVEGGVVLIKHRVEPITSLYVDLEAASGGVGGAGVEEDEGPASMFTSVAGPKTTVKPTVKPKTAEEEKVGAIIGQTKKVLKLKKTQATATQATPAAAIGGSGLT
jgi:hypothetical protein